MSDKEYRPYLDGKYHQQFDDFLAERTARRAEALKFNYDYIMHGSRTTKRVFVAPSTRNSRLPSEYFGTNIFVGASTMSLEEVRRRHVIGCDVMMWGTDYPHPEGTWPHTVEALKRSFAEIPVEDTARLVGLTRSVVTAWTKPG